MRRGCGTKPKRLQTKLKKREWARIDARDATPYCINQIQIYENHREGWKNPLDSSHEAHHNLIDGNT